MQPMVENWAGSKGEWIGGIGIMEKMGRIDR